MPGGASAEAPGLFSGIMRYIMAMQQEYYRSMAGALRAVDLQGSAAAAWTLASLSFLYGIFHAAGPGHGKIVVASYILADEREVRRGIMVAFLSAFAQAITAITAVGLLSLALGLTHRTTASAIPHIERASFVLIAALGAWLIWRAVRGGHEHEHAHEHDHDHAHMPTPAELRKAKGFREMAAMVLSVGLRPCSGAVLVLLFAVTQGAFLIGAASALVMSLGTAITVSVLAILTVFSKNAALRLARRMDSPWAARIEPILMAGGGAIILVFGVLLFASTFAGPSSPLL
ncbi:MAG: nickel/cobalt transporter [Parvibaculum sp.]|uniref:nickel/cobalt transporter n=1 Tax=Parvibaculum sp. TaxID=2024848 RepID=UPI002AB82B51|nr:nickel/cobalt transporter [Parvibaculum sp.]MDZ4380142.1 nickel/cobalt transporter [Parvibaculum sp.]